MSVTIQCYHSWMQRYWRNV